MYPNVIIAGTNKAGTTSLFRYLADHPNVCASAIKEVRHFTREADPLGTEALARYAAQFAHYSGESVCLEASPDYLSGGATVATALRALLPEARLVFILREPVSRLVSSYRRRQSRQDKHLAGVSLQQYLDSLVAGSADSPAAAELAGVQYADLLETFFEHYPAAQVAVRFFDELGADTPAFVADICRFAGLDAAFYADYPFRVENQTRNVRFKQLQKLAHRANMAVEPVLNRSPSLRRGLRQVYNRLNTSESPGVQDSYDATALQQSLHDDSRRLSRLLAERYPDLAQPAWLTRTASRA